MPESKPSRQELIQRRRRRGFVGRRDELTVFRDNFARGPHDETYQFLFHLHGNAGVAKTSLVRQWETMAHEQQAVTATVAAQAGLIGLGLIPGVGALAGAVDP